MRLLRRTDYTGCNSHRSPTPCILPTLAGHLLSAAFEKINLLAERTLAVYTPTRTSLNT